MSLTLFSLLSLLITLSLHFVASNNITPFIPNGKEPPEGWPYVVAFEGAGKHLLKTPKLLI
jgi:hypothetical protein